MIPKNGEKVFRGILFDVYHWKQKMLDDSYKTFEAVKRKPSVQLIVTHNDKIVLIHEEQPFVGKFVTFPGGFVEEKNPQRAAVRELLEETGMRASKIELLMKTTMGSKLQWDTYYYIMKNCKVIDTQHLDKGGEKITPFLVSFDEFVEITSREDFRNKEFSNYMFRVKHDPRRLLELKHKIFANNENSEKKITHKITNKLSTMKHKIKKKVLRRKYENMQS